MCIKLVELTALFVFHFLIFLFVKIISTTYFYVVLDKKTKHNEQKKNSLDVGTMLYFMIMNDLFILLLKRLSEGYKFPVYKTESCPKSNAEWLERSSSLRCNETNGYMCIPNEKITMLLEFCYHVPKTIIPKGKEG